MNLFRLRTVLTCTAIFVGAIGAGGCGDDDVDPIAKDSGVAEDAGEEDGGRDGGVDAGRRDGGSTVTMNAEGYACTPSMTSNQGSCTDPTNFCVDFADQLSEENEVVGRCIRPCTSDADCAGSPSGNLCRASVLEDKICVSAEVGEGEKIDLSLLNTGAMTGCADGLFGAPRVSFGVLFSLQADQFSCARRCNTGTDCTTPGSNFCLPDIINPMVFTSSTAGLGLCMTRQAKKGARCSRYSINDVCDPEDPNLVCVDVGLSRADNIPADEDYGVCLELCDVGMNTCTMPTHPGLTATCDAGFFSSPTLGVCTDNCTGFPDNCSAGGSTPASNHTQRGSSCWNLGDATADFNLCFDVNQAIAPFPLFNFMTLPNPNCIDNANQCPDKSTCVGLGDAQGSSGCIRGCRTATTAQPAVGCEGITEFANPECEAATTSTSSRDGFCVPGM